MIVRAAILLFCWLAVIWWVFLDNDLVGGEFFVGAASCVVVRWLWGLDR